MIRLLPCLADLAFVVVFAVIGRASHGEALSLGGIAATAWPFLVACAFAWLVVALLEDDGLNPRSAFVVWLVTLVGGMGLRILAGGGFAWAFGLVAAAFLAAAMAGWRLSWRWGRHAQSPGASA